MVDIALQGAVEAYSHAVCKAIWACRQLRGVVQLLQLAAATLLDASDQALDGVKDGLEGLEGDLQEQWHQLQALGRGRWQLVRPCFYGLPFWEFGEVLLSVVAPDWRPSFSPQLDASLFLRFFREAPADAALQVLVMHLASVELPAHQPVRRGKGVTVTAVSADVACELLAERFARPASPGLQQLLAAVSWESSGGMVARENGRAWATAEGEPSGSSGAPQQQARIGVQGRWTVVDSEALAATLASIPERAAPCDAPLLLPFAFVPLLVGQVLAWLQQLWPRAAAKQEAAGAMAGIRAAGQQAGGEVAGNLDEQTWAGEPRGRSLDFAASLVGRLCRRGHAQYAAAALWQAIGTAVQQHLQQGQQQQQLAGLAHANANGSSSNKLAVATMLVGAIADSAALEKLVEELLRVLAAEAARGPATRMEAPFDPEPVGLAAEHTRAPAAGTGSAAGEASVGAVSAGEATAGDATAAMLTSPPASPAPALGPPAVTDALAVAALHALLPPATWAARPDLQYTLGDKLLTQRALPPAALRWVICYIDSVNSVGGGTDGNGATTAPAAEGSGGGSSGLGGLGLGWGDGQAGIHPGLGSDALAEVACQLARVWGDPSTLQRLPPQQQAYLTAALAESMARLGSRRFQAHPELLGAVLSGVGARLESPMQTLRRQAMRVGHSMSLLLDPSRPLFEEERPWELLPAEQWWDEGAEEGKGKRGTEGFSGRPAARQTTADGVWRGAAGARGAVRAGPSGSTQGAGVVGREEEGEWPLTETDSDDEMLGAGSGDEDLEPYDLEESDEEDPRKSGLQLRDLTSLLLKGEQDWKGQLRALRSAEALIRAAPDELEHYGVPLARALLHTPLPKWAGEEAKAGEEPPEIQRFRALVAATVETPSTTGLALASELYSPSLDMYHRDLVLSTLSTAAQEMANPGTFLQPLPGVTTQHAHSEALGSAGTRAAAGLGQGGARRRVGRVTRASERALASMAARGRALEHVNRFPSVALSWAAALLRECDRQHHGIDLFGRDFFLLGRLLITLGTLMECCTHAPQAMPLAAAVVELVRGQRVHAHPEPYVRRAALLAVSQVMTSLSPARVSAAMLGAVASTASLDSQDAALVARLDWVRQWTESIAEEDPDEGCRKMAGACRRLQASLAAGALASLDSAGERGLLGGVNGGGSSGELLPAPQQGVRVSVPRLEELRLG